MTTPPITQQATVRSRIKPVQWAIVAIFTGLGLVWLPMMAMGASSDPGQRIGGYIMLSFCLVPASGFAAWLLITEIVADAQGIHWRDIQGRHTASWEEVTDFYELPPASRQKGSTPRLVVETVSGKPMFGNNGWTNVEALKTAIQQNATKAHTKVWGMLGEREKEPLPRTFDYNTSDNRFQRRLAIIGQVACLGFGLWMLRKAPATFSTLGWQWGLASIGIVIFGLIPFALVVWIAVRQMTETRRRLKQRVTVTDEGLEFDNAGECLTIAWPDITAYLIKPMRMGFRYVIVTRHGKQDFLPMIGHSEILCKMINRCATSAKTTEWRSAEDDVLGGKSSRWSSGCEGVGERVFHYRTRTLRALLLFPTVLAAEPLLLIFLASLGLSPSPSWGTSVLLCSLAFWAWWRYSVARIQVDATGLTQLTIFGPRRLRWDQVERFYLSGGDAFKFGNVAGAGTRVRFWIGIADLEELKAEVARRAVNSRNRTWDEAETNKQATAVKEQ